MQIAQQTKSDQTKNLWLALITAVLILVSQPLVGAFAAVNSGSPLPVLKGEVGATDTTGGAARNKLLGFQCEKEGSTPWPARITKVIAGSPAAFRGLAEGDRILSLKTVGLTTNLVIQRGSRQYSASLSKDMDMSANATSTIAKSPVSISPPQARVVQAAAKNVSTTSGTTIANVNVKAPFNDQALSAEIQTSQQQLQALAEHDIVVIVDKSGSMAEHDCPGEQSRWDWCRNQTIDLSQKTAPYVKHGITLVTFSSDYTVYENTTMDKVGQVFRDNVPLGGTNTGDALKSQLDAYFRRGGAQHSKPLLVAVVTDGAPQDPDYVEQVIIEATQRISSADDITIVFLQIGNEAVATGAFERLDNELVAEGARYDIVQARTFAELQQIGLTQSMVDALSNKKAPALTSPPAARPINIPKRTRRFRSFFSPLDHRLQDAEDKRAQLEQQLLQRAAAQ